MVLVSHTHRFIFLKTSKTAGTSVEMALEHACAPDGHVAVEKTPTLMSEQGIIGSRVMPCELPPQPALEKGMWCNHKSAAGVKNDLGPDRFAQYTKITTVRNPFDRYVSAFHWLHPQLVRQAKTFAELKQMFQNFVLERKWRTDKNNVFIGKNFIIDRAIRFEHLMDDLMLLAGNLGVAVSTNAMPHTKSTQASRKDYKVPDYFDQRCIDIVRRRSSWVFEQYDYAEVPQ